MKEAAQDNGLVLWLTGLVPTVQVTLTLWNAMERGWGLWDGGSGRGGNGAAVARVVQ